MTRHSSQNGNGTKPRAEPGVKLARPSPLTGYRLPVGAHPGNTGGKPGRSGRKPDAFKEALAAIRDEQGMDVLCQVLDGNVTYTFNAVCSECGKTSTGPLNFEDMTKLVPSVDARLRAAEMTLRYTVGLEKTIRLEGPLQIQEAFDTIKGRIRAALAPAVADELIVDITSALKSL